MGGLTLTLPGHESLSATQIVFDEVTGLAAVMKLFNRNPGDQTKNHALLAPMMALSQPDPGLGFPSGTTLIPRIFLRNAAVDSTQVSVTVDWRSGSKSGELVPSPLDLSPGEVKVINLADYQKSGQMPADAAWATVRLGYTGRSADLVPVAVSYDNDNRYGLQTPFSEGIAHMWAGGMWHADPTHNTFITTGNGGSESTTAQVTLFYNNGKGKYRIEKMLSPSQQLWLDVGRLIRNQVPDSDGRTLPPDTMTGSYELRDLDHATVGLLYEGKLVIDKTYGHAAYGCGSCCGYTTPELVPDPFAGPPGVGYTEVMQCTEQCSGDLVDVAESASGWQSSNTAVATLPNITLHTVAAGNATGSATIQLEATHPAPIFPTRDYGPSQPVTVQTPTSLSVLNVTVLPNGSGPPNGCPGSANYGIMVDIKYQVLDQNTQPILSANMTPHENGTFFTGGTYDNNIGPVSGYPTSSATTASDGTFHDVPFGGCANGAFSSFTATQNITIIMPDGSSPAVRSQTFTLTGTTAGHGTLKNGSDISATR